MRERRGRAGARGQGLECSRDGRSRRQGGNSGGGRGSGRTRGNGDIGGGDDGKAFFVEGRASEGDVHSLLIVDRRDPTKDFEVCTEDRYRGVDK